MRQLTLLLLLAAFGVGCSSEPAPAPTSLGAAPDPIVYADGPDSREAVVAYRIGGGGWCTATVVHTSGTTGFALTAAHCLPSSAPWGWLRQGDGRAPGEYHTEYTITDADIHPDYDGGNTPLYDFAMLTFSGVTAVTEVIPVMQPSQDLLHDGSMVDIVGYGQTELGSNTVRLYVHRAISDVSPMRLSFDQSGTSGGMCFGDSGGPVLANIGGDLVAGVNSGVSDSSCFGWGTAVRASSVRNTFILPYINNQPYGLQSCSHCYDAATYGGACQTQVESCFDDTDCTAYANCLSGCGTSNCRLQCALDHMSGLAVYQLIDDCVCTVGCTAECQSDAVCGGGSDCGFTSSSSQCQDCFEEHCCAEAQACADDYPICASCFSTVAHASCPTTEAAAFQSCLEQNCPIACNAGLGGSGGVGGSGGAGAAGGLGGGPLGGSAPGGTGGATLPASSGDSETDSGCSCTIQRRDRGHHRWPWLFGLASLTSLARRRRRPSSAPVAS